MKGYDVLFGLIIRIYDNSEDIDVFDEKLKDYSEQVGDYVSRAYPNCFITPIALQEASDEGDDVYSLLESFKLIEEN